MSRFARPDELGPHLEENAQALERILGVDARPLTVFGRIEAIARAWAHVQRRMLQPYGINYAEISTLGILRAAKAGACAPSELRTLVGQTSAGMTRILDKLEGEGLVRRVPHAGDGRRVDIQLTRSGTAFADECLEAMLTLESDLLAGIGKAKLDALVSGVDALLDAFADEPT